MIFRKIDYIIFYEHVARELASVEQLHIYLKNMGLTGVILPIHFNRYINTIKFRPKVIVVPYYYNKRTGERSEFYTSLYNDVITVNLNSEQLTNPSTVKFKLPSDSSSKAAIQIAWSDTYKRILQENGIPESNIYVTGSIRNDLLKNVSIDCCEENILIPTSFSITFVSKKYIDKLSQDSRSMKEMYEKIDFTRKSRDSFFKVVYNFSKLRSEKIILRPHPYVDLDDYRSVFLEINDIDKLPNNIIIERRGSIQDAISLSHSVIVWHSTSVLDAYLMNKKVIVLAPIEFNRKYGMEFMDYIPAAKDEYELNEIINKEQYINLLDDYIKHNYGEVDGKAYKRLGDVIHKLSQRKLDQKVSLIYFIKMFFKSIYIDFFKFIFLKINILHLIKNEYKGILEDSIEIK